MSQGMLSKLYKQLLERKISQTTICRIENGTISKHQAMRFSSSLFKLFSMLEQTDLKKLRVGQISQPTSMINTPKMMQNDELF